MLAGRFDGTEGNLRPSEIRGADDTQQELCMNDTEDQNRYLLNHASTSTKRHVGTGDPLVFWGLLVG